MAPSSFPRQGASNKPRAIQLQDLLELGDKDDVIVLQVVSQLDNLFPDELPMHIADLFWTSGIRVLELDDDVGETMLQGSLKRRAAAATTSERYGPLDIAARLAAISIWLQYGSAIGWWRWYWDELVLEADALSDAENRRMAYIGATRAGAAAMLGGNESIALRIASDLKTAGVALDKLETFVRHPGVAELEKMDSQRMGDFLGSDPEASLAAFAQFARDTAGIT